MFDTCIMDCATLQQVLFFGSSHFQALLGGLVAERGSAVARSCASTDAGNAFVLQKLLIGVAGGKSAEAIRTYLGWLGLAFEPAS